MHTHNISQGRFHVIGSRQRSHKKNRVEEKESKEKLVEAKESLESLQNVGEQTNHIPTCSVLNSTSEKHSLLTKTL